MKDNFAKAGARLAARVVPVLLLVGLVSQGVRASSVDRRELPLSSSAARKIDPSLRLAMVNLQPDEMTTVIVTLRSQEDLSAITGSGKRDRRRRVVAALQHRASTTQVNLRRLIRAGQARGRIGQVSYLWIFNGLAVTAKADAIAELAASPEVSSVIPDQTFSIPRPEATTALPEANLSAVSAPALWDLGYTGQGVVVANMDTGVDASHPDLADRWRGGSNSWYDPYGQHPTTPADVSGHGTWTMGVMVGGDLGGTAIGVAPGAQWIAVKIFNDQGSATASAIHLGYQWLLDPDGDPSTSDAPDVVNNSWDYSAPGCNLDFQLDLQALRASEILPVFSAGNYGPYNRTSTSPANNPEAFAVGAINNTGLSYYFSSHGPSSCGEPSTIYPELAAPGVNIRSTDLYGSYFSASGTSLSAPHVSGALALLLSAFPDLSAAQQETVLKSSAADLGLPGPDNVTGYGRLDVLAAYNLLAGSGSPSSTPTATGTPTSTSVSLPTPTATASATSTASASPTFTPTATPTASPTSTSTASPSPTATPSATPTFTTTALPSATVTPSPTRTPTATPTRTSTAFPSATVTPSPTATPTRTATLTPSASSSPTSTTTPTSTSSSNDLIFADDFETGSLSAWSARVDAENDLSAAPAAALVHASGMAALIDNTTSMYLRDDTPASEPRYSVRYYFDPNSLTMANGDTHAIFTARNNTTDILRLDFGFISGSYQVRVYLRTDTAATITNWVALTDAAHAIELDWAAASGPGVNNGSLSLWIDGAQVANLTGLDNDTHRIEQARLGPYVGIDAATSGTEYFDAYVSGRSSYIGP